MTFEQYQKMRMQSFDFYYEVINDAKPISKNEFMLKYTETGAKKYREKILPHVINIGKTVGEKNSLFNPIRKITRVDLYNGVICVFWKEPRQRNERFKEICTV